MDPPFEVSLNWSGILMVRNSFALMISSDERLYVKQTQDLNCSVNAKPASQIDANIRRFTEKFPSATQASALHEIEVVGSSTNFKG